MQQPLVQAPLGEMNTIFSCCATEFSSVGAVTVVTGDASYDMEAV